MEAQTVGGGGGGGLPNTALHCVVIQHLDELWCELLCCPHILFNWNYIFYPLSSNLVLVVVVLLYFTWTRSLAYIICLFVFVLAINSIGQCVLKNPVNNIGPCVFKGDSNLKFCFCFCKTINRYCLSKIFPTLHDWNCFCTNENVFMFNQNQTRIMGGMASWWYYSILRICFSCNDN